MSIVSQFNNYQEKCIILYDMYEGFDIDSLMREAILKDLQVFLALKYNIICKAGPNILKAIQCEITIFKNMIPLRYSGIIVEWIMIDLNRCEILTREFRYQWAYNIIQIQWKKTYALRFKAACKIQNKWRRVISDPTHIICKNRLQWEFSNL